MDSCYVMPKGLALNNNRGHLPSCLANTFTEQIKTFLFAEQPYITAEKCIEFCLLDCLRICSLACSFVHLFTRSFVSSFICSFVWLVGWFLLSTTCSYTLLSICKLTPVLDAILYSSKLFIWQFLVQFHIDSQGDKGSNLETKSN